LVGNLVLLLMTATLSGTQKEEEILTPVEYLAELPLEEEAESFEKVKIETNTAYNEAEKFISELENSRNETETTSEEKSDLETESKLSSTNNDLALNDARDKLSEVKEKLSKDAKARLSKTESASVNKKTTISYQLIDRKKLHLPNPVYTCDRGGKVVISIEVNALGKVVKTTYNKAASNTTNGCLIESALHYATSSNFTTKAGKNKQIGTITYLFPGQY
jgi:hypothetical protein